MASRTSPAAASPRRGFHETMRHWRSGVRLYIFLAILLVTAEVWWWAMSQYGATNIAYIKIEQVYAWLSLGLLAWAVVIGPLYAVFGRLSGRLMSRDARRMLGIGAAWFALLHVGVVLWHQFTPSSLTALASDYKLSFVLGVSALIILLLMALTSFNTAMRVMKTWWFRLHRLVYIAVAAALLHSFIIGTHATTWNVVIILSEITLAVLVLHGWLAIRRGPRSLWRIGTLLAMTLLLGAILAYGIMISLQNGGPGGSGTL